MANKFDLIWFDNSANLVRRPLQGLSGAVHSVEGVNVFADIENVLPTLILNKEIEQRLTQRYLQFYSFTNLTYRRLQYNKIIWFCDIASHPLLTRRKSLAWSHMFIKLLPSPRRLYFCQRPSVRLSVCHDYAKSFQAILMKPCRIWTTAMWRINVEVDPTQNGLPAAIFYFYNHILHMKLWNIGAPVHYGGAT